MNMDLSLFIKKHSKKLSHIGIEIYTVIKDDSDLTKQLKKEKKELSIIPSKETVVTENRYTRYLKRLEEQKREALKVK